MELGGYLGLGGRFGLHLVMLWSPCTQGPLFAVLEDHMEFWG